MRLVAKWYLAAVAVVCGGAGNSQGTEEWQVWELPVERAFVASDFRLVKQQDSGSSRPLENGEARFSTEYVSVDAATRLWTDGGGEAQGWDFFGKLQKKKGDTMFSFGAVLRCEESKHAKWKKGDIAVGSAPVKGSLILNPDKLRKGVPGLDPTAELSILGTTTGITAYLALEKLGPTDLTGKTAYVSAAAGGVGLLVCQLLKLKGARVLGSSGSAIKVNRLVQGYGVEAFNYKDEPVQEALARLAPDGVDLFFDNVGGTTLDAALVSMKKYGTVILCGAVSQYSSTKTGLTNTHAISDKSLSLKGFIVADWVPDFSQARDALAALAKAGRVKAEVALFPWAAFGQAHHALHAGLTLGKVLVAGPRVGPDADDADDASSSSGGGSSSSYFFSGGGKAAVGHSAAGTAADVTSLVVAAGAELGRDATAYARSLVEDHWFDSIAAVRNASVADLVAAGLPSRLALLVAERALDFQPTQLYANGPPEADPSIKPRSLPASAGADAIAAAMLEDGYCVVTGLADADDTASLRKEMDEAGFIFKGTKGSWSGEDTRRNSAVVLGKSKTAQKLAAHELSLAVVDKILLPYTKRVKLGVATRIVKVAGHSNDTYQAPRQVLHRDDYQFAASDWPYVDGFRPEFCVGVMFAATDFTAANGATNVVPGSHLWPPSPIDGKRPSEGTGGLSGLEPVGGGLPPDVQIVPGAMPAGSALFYLGSTLHGAGQHDGTAPPRDGLIFIYYLGWLNNLINFHFGIPNEIQKEMDPKLQELLGHASDGTDYDHPWIKGPLYTLPYQGSPGTLASLTDADRAGAVGASATTSVAVDAKQHAVPVAASTTASGGSILRRFGLLNAVP